MRKLLVKNSLSGVAQSLVNIALVFTVIPVFIKILGTEEYGVFSLIITVGNLNIFTNLGLTSALIKFLAEQGKVQESNYDIVITFLLTTSLLLPFSLTAIYFNKFILLSILNVPVNLFAEARIFYIFILGANFLLISGQIAKAVLDSGQRIVITNFLQILYNFIYWGLILLVLLLGYSLPQVGMASLFSALIWFSLIAYNALQYWGKLSLEGILKNYIRVVKKQLAYGSKIYASGLIGFFYEPFSKILISYFIGITEVGFFDIAIRIKNQLWGIVLKIFYPLYPLLSSIKDKNKVRLLVQDLEEKTFFFIMPFVAIIIFSTFPFVHLWIGKDVEIIAISVVSIVAVNLIRTTVIPNYQFLIAKGFAGKTVILQSSNVLTNFIVFGLSYQLIGYYAAILGNISSIFTSYVLALYFQKKYLGVLIFDSKNKLFKLVFIFGANLAIGAFLQILINNNLEKILITTPVLIITSLVMYKYLNIFNREDIYKYVGNNKLLRKWGMIIFG